MKIQYRLSFTRMQLCAVIGLAFSLFMIKLKCVNCSHQLNDDTFLKKEVEDFEEFLQEKLAKDPTLGKDHLPEHFDVDHNSKEQREYSHDNIIFENSQPHSDDFESHLKNLARNEVEIEEKESQESSSNSETRAAYSNSEVSDEVPDKHHGVKEIIYIRQSDSEEDDPIPEIIEELTHDAKPHLELKEAPDDSTVNDEPSSSDDQDSQSRPTDCSTHPSSSKLHQTCESGPEYKIRFHNKYTDHLKRDMDSMLPVKNPDDSKCDYSKNKGPVEDRALCPFEWKVSDYNPARIPPYLYTAKCSCTLSRPVRKKMFQCIPLKRAIPVLWEVGCENGQKKYKSGWEEVAVACVPLEERESEVPSYINLH